MSDCSVINHYVYLYRDERGRPRYVGYGQRPNRATAHLIASHNPNLSDFILTKKFTIEVAGPFGSGDIGRAVESALISALKPDLNVKQGSGTARFRPFGVPAEFADRPWQHELLREDFLQAQGDSPMPVLFVYVGDTDFDDGRVGYDLANTPSDDQVVARVEKWWQLQKFVPVWSAVPHSSPGILVGIHGSPGAQLVIAAILIDRTGWNTAQHSESGGGRIRVPLLATPNLDAFGLRGRRISRAAGLAFEGFPAGFFIVLNSDCSSIGGRRNRKSKTDHIS